MAQWYYNLNGYMKGPVRQKEVQKLIYDGVLSATDIIYRDGAEEWKALKHYSEFDLRQPSDENIHQFVGIPDIAEKLELGMWMVLVRKQGEQATEFVQLGPMPMPEIRSKLVSRELQLGDHIWRSGMSRWVRLGSLPEFDRRTPEKSHRSWVYAGLGVSVIVFLALALPRIPWQQVKTDLLEPGLKSAVEGPVVQAPAPLVVEKKPVKVVKKKKENTAARKKRVKKAKPAPPPRLKIASSSRDRVARRLRLALNSSTSRRVQVQLKSSAGSTLAAKAFYKRIEWKRKVGEQVLDLKKYRVPEGYYDIEVRAGPLRDSKRLFFGNSKLFRSQMRKKLKQSSFAAQVEKGELLSQLRRHAKLLNQVAGLGRRTSSWQKKWNGLNTGRLRDFREIRASSFYYPVFWGELRELRKRVRSDLFGYGDAVDAGRARSFEKQLVGILRNVQKFTLWQPTISRNL